MPENILIKVDLPAPLGPIIPNISPLLTPKVNFLSVGLPLIYSFSKLIDLIGSVLSGDVTLCLSSNISYSRFSLNSY